MIGLNCELDTNACSNEPCSLHRNCTDLTPEEENRLGRGYNCSGCPKGYNDMNNKCEGNKEFKYDFQLKGKNIKKEIEFLICYFFLIKESSTFSNYS